MAWPVSPAWRPAVAASTQRAVVRVDVLEPSGALAQTLAVTGGNVDTDAARAVRRQCSLEISRDVVSARDLLELLDPRSRSEVRVWRGIDYGASVELVPLGTFTPTKPSASSDLGVTLKVTGLDRSRRLARARWTTRFPIAAGTNVAVAIASIVADRAPWLPVDCAPTTVTTPAMWLGLDPGQGSPWADIATLAQSAAMEAIIDPMGTLVTRLVPDPTVTPVVAAFIEGPDCTLTKATVSLDDEQTFNGVILTAEGTGIAVPLRSESWDTDPGSLTCRAVYGDVPFFATTNIAVDQTSNDAACAAMLRQMLGLTQQATLEAVPDASLDAGDVLRVGESRTSLSGLCIVDTVTIPLKVGDVMALGLRERRIL